MKHKVLIPVISGFLVLGAITAPGISSAESSDPNAATDTLAAVTTGWPTPAGPHIEDRLRATYFKVYDDLKAHPGKYVGFYHTGDQVKVLVPRGKSAEAKARLADKGAAKAQVVESGKSSAARLLDIKAEALDTIPSAWAVGVDWQAHLVIVTVEKANDEIREQAKSLYGDDVILQHRENTTRALESRDNDASPFAGGSEATLYTSGGVATQPCTAGVPWKLGTEQFMVTAGHCQPTDVLPNPYSWFNNGWSTGNAMGTPYTPDGAWAQSSWGYDGDTWKAFYNFDDGWSPDNQGTYRWGSGGNYAQSFSGPHPLNYTVASSPAYGASDTSGALVTGTVNLTVNSPSNSSGYTTGYGVQINSRCKRTNGTLFDGGGQNISATGATYGTGAVAFSIGANCATAPNTGATFQGAAITQYGYPTGTTITDTWYPTGHPSRPSATTGSTFGSFKVVTAPTYNASGNSGSMGIYVKQKSGLSVSPVTQVKVTNKGWNGSALVDCNTTTKSIGVPGSGTATDTATLGNCTSPLQYRHTEFLYPISATEAGQSSANWTGTSTYYPPSHPSRVTNDVDDWASTLNGCSGGTVTWNDSANGDLALIDTRWDKDHNPTNAETEHYAWFGGSTTTAKVDISGGYGQSAVNDDLIFSTKHGDLTDGSGTYEVKLLDQDRTPVTIGACSGSTIYNQTVAEKDWGTCAQGGDSGSAVIEDTTYDALGVVSNGSATTYADQIDGPITWCETTYTELSLAHAKWGGDIP